MLRVNKRFVSFIREEILMGKKTKEKKTREGWRLSGIERVRYYLGDLGVTVGVTVLAGCMTNFLAFRGLNLAALAGAIFILKIIDAVDDVIFGYLVDKVKITEWKVFKKLTSDGKYLPWYRMTFALFPIFTIVFYLMPNNISQTAKMVWFFVTYLLYDLSCTLCEVPKGSLVITLTDNTDERAHLITVKGILAVVAAVVVNSVSSFLWDPVAGPGLSFASVTIVVVTICLLMMIPLALKGKEYNTELKNVEKEVDKDYTLKDMWNCVKTNKYMAIFLFSNLCAGIAGTSNAVFNMVAFYLFEGKTAINSLPYLLGFIPALIINTQADKIAKRFGRRNSMIILGLIFGAMFVFQYISGYNNLVLIVVFGTLGAIAASVRYIFVNFIAPDTIEFTRYKTGKDCAGIFYALSTFVEKATGAFASSLGLLILSLYGWNEVQAESYEQLLQMGVGPGQAAYQTPTAIHGMWVVYCLIPGIGYLVSALVLFLYKLKDRDAELMARCNAGDITREECESQLSRKY